MKRQIETQVERQVKKTGWMENRQKKRQVNKLEDRKAENYAGRQRDRLICRQVHSLFTERQVETQTVINAVRQADRQVDCYKKQQCTVKSVSFSTCLSFPD